MPRPNIAPGASPLMFACRSEGFQAAVHAPFSYCSRTFPRRKKFEVRVLLDNGADVNLANQVKFNNVCSDRPDAEFPFFDVFPLSDQRADYYAYTPPYANRKILLTAARDRGSELSKTSNTTT